MYDVLSLVLVLVVLVVFLVGFNIRFNRSPPLSPTNPVNDNILLYEARLIITIEDKDKRPKIFRIEINLTTQHKPNSKKHLSSVAVVFPDEVNEINLKYI